MSAYSFSLTTFNPSGKLLQIEHALNSISRNGRLALGLKSVNGVVLVTEKKSGASKLIDEKSIQKISEISPHIGCTFSGMPGDFRVILAKARKEAQIYYRKYYTEIPVQQLVQRIASVVQEFTQSGGVRPFGVSLLIAGYDEINKMQLYQIDPSGAYFPWKATVLGKDSAVARLFIEKRYNDSMEIEDAVHTALLTLKDAADTLLNQYNTEIAIIQDNGLLKLLTPDEVKDYIAEIE